MKMGTVEVLTPPREMQTEEWAQLFVARLISVADTMPKAIRDQANAFREQIQILACHYMRQAIMSDRAVLAKHMAECGHPEFSSLIHLH